MPHPKVKIADNSGNEVGVTSNALDVNIAGGASIDIGDVDMFLDGGTAVLGGAGAVAAGVLRVTLASDDVHFGEVGDGASVSGAVHAQLRAIGNSFGGLATSSTQTTIRDYIGQSLVVTGAQYSEGDVNTTAIVRNDTLASLATDNNDYAPLQVNAEGALYTTGNTLQNGLLHGENFTVMGESKTIDGSALPNIVAEGRNARLAVSRSGIAYACLTDPDGASDLGTTITTHLSEIEGAVETIEGAVSGSEMQVDVVGSLPAGDNNIGNVDIVTLPASTNTIEVVGDAAEDAAVAGNPILVGGRYDSSDRSLDDGDVGAIALSDEGFVKIDWEGDITSTASVIQATGGTYATGDRGIQIFPAVRSDTLAVLGNVANGDWTPAQVDAEGALYTTHGITGGADGVTTDDTNGTVLGGDVSCKKIDIQAQTDNTGVVAVGFTGVDATIATGTGILLNAGDAYSLEINNLNLIYIESSVNGEGVRYTYFT